MPDNVLEIGATIDLGELLPGLDAMASGVEDSTEAMEGSFQSVAAVTNTSFGALEAAIQKLIASSQQLADSSAEMAGIVSASMSKVAVGTEEAAVESESSLLGIKEAFLGVAESAELSAGGAVSALGPLGALFGAGIATHYIEELKEVVLSEDRLAQVTGISVAAIAEFRDAMEKLGVPTENISRVLLHVSESAQQAADGQKEAQQAFKQLGIDTDEWNGKAPNTLDLLLKISDHLKEFQGSTSDAAAATHVLGLRMGVELAGGLSVGSEKIRELMRDAQGLGKATQDAVEPAKQFQEAEAEIAASIQESALPALQKTADALVGLRIIYAALKATVIETFNAISIPVADAILALQGYAAVAQDVVTLNWSAAKSDAIAYWHGIGDQTAEAVQKIKDADKEYQDLVGHVLRGSQQLGSAGARPTAPVVPLEGKEKNTADEIAKARIEAEEHTDETLAAIRLESVKQLESIGRASFSDVLAAQRTEENELYAIKLKAFNEEKALAEKQVAGGDKGKEAEVIRINAEIEGLTAKHFAKLDELTTAATKHDIDAQNQELTAYLDQQNKQEKAAEEAAKKHQQAVEQFLKIDAEQVSEAKKNADEILRDSESSDKEKLEAHKITLRQWAAADIDAINKWEQSQRKALNDALADMRRFGLQNTAEYKRITQQLEALDKERETKTNEVNKQIEEKAQQAYQKIDNFINADLTKWITGHETFGKAVIQIWQQMETAFVEYLLRQTEQYLLGVATQKAAAQGQVNANAAVAGSGAMASLASIPIIGPALAAAAGVAIRLQALTVGSFDEGGLATKSGLAMIHQSEIVLPPSVSSGFRSLAAGSGIGGGSRTVHNHNTFNLTHNGPDAREVLDKELVPRIQQALRRGSV